MSQSLPMAIVTHLTALGSALVATAAQHRGGTLVELETEVRRTVRAALGGLLGAVVDLATPDLDPGIATVQRRCPRCDRLIGALDQRDRTVRTTCGALAFTRPWYHCTGCQHGFSPADAALALPPLVRISPALEAWLVRLAATAPPRESAALLTELTGLVVHHDTLREHATVVGAAPSCGGCRRHRPGAGHAGGGRARRAGAGRAGGGNRWRDGAISERLARSQAWGGRGHDRGGADRAELRRRAGERRAVWAAAAGRSRPAGGAGGGALGGTADSAGAGGAATGAGRG